MNRERLEELLFLSQLEDMEEADRVELNDHLRQNAEARAFASKYLSTNALLVDTLGTQSTELQFVIKKQRKSYLSFTIATAAVLVFAFALNFIMHPKESSVANVSGTSLKIGEVFELNHGESKIKFEDGALLAVEGPVKLKILGSNSARLYQGVVTVRVPGPKKGFELETPSKKVVDLGTSFGVDVNSSGETSLLVFEGEVEVGDQKFVERLEAGDAVKMNKQHGQASLSISYDSTPFLGTWKSSFGVEELTGDVHFAKPSERKYPAKIVDSNSLYLIPELEGVEAPAGMPVSFLNPGSYTLPFMWDDSKSPSKNPVYQEKTKLQNPIYVDSYLLQYNPGLPSPTSKTRPFVTEVVFDREIIAVIAQKDILKESDLFFALDGANFSHQKNRGLADNDIITLSPDRRTLHVSVDIEDGVDQIRVLVSSHL